MKCTARRHGTEWAYSKHRCRCPKAIAAARAKWQQRNKARTERARQARLNVDQVAIDMVCSGASMRLPLVERAVAFARLDALDLPTDEIARRLRITVRTVQRRRAAARTSQVGAGR